MHSFPFRFHTATLFHFTFAVFSIDLYFFKRDRSSDRDRGSDRDTDREWERERERVGKREIHELFASKWEHILCITQRYYHTKSVTLLLTRGCVKYEPWIQCFGCIANLTLTVNAFICNKIKKRNKLNVFIYVLLKSHDKINKKPKRSSQTLRRKFKI